MLDEIINAMEWLIPAVLATFAMALLGWWIYVGEVYGLDFVG